MKIAFCGAGSTGKTTLALRMMAEPEIVRLGYERVNVDSRQLIQDLGYKNIDEFTKSDLQRFEQEYSRNKAAFEDGRSMYFTDHGFVDQAAYWKVRDAVDEPIEIVEPFINKCKNNSFRYDLHIFCPVGLFDIQFDGFRTTDISEYKRVSDAIETFLKEWKLPHIALNTANLDERVDIVKNYILNHSDDISKN